MKSFNHDQAFPASGAMNHLPEQALPNSKKDDKWIQSNLDALENIGLQQLPENMAFKDFYRMKDGKLSFMELSKVIPQLRKVEDLRKLGEIPSFIKHYDLIGTFVNAFVGFLSQVQDQYFVVGTDETETNEYLETKKELLTRFISERWQNIIQKKLVERGVNLDMESIPEEQREQYAQQVQQMQQEMTPPEIQRYMDTSFKTAAALWGDGTIEADRFRFYMDEIDTENFVDYILTGRCFRNMFIGPDYYKPERWSPLNTFYSQTLDSKFPQYGEYIGRIHYFTAGQLINRYGNQLTAKQKQELLGGALWGDEYTNNRTPHQNHYYYPEYAAKRVPFEGYDDYMSIVAKEDFYGIPLGQITQVGEDGVDITRPRFMPRYHNINTLNYARLLSDVEIRDDLYQVTEAYWVSYKRVFMVTFHSPSGLVLQEIVTDELLTDFLKENGIKKIKRTMKDGLENPEPDTYYEDYVPEVRYGVKISGMNTRGEAIYLDGNPIAHQIKGDSNLYDFVLPVAGFVGESLAKKIEPWQVLYNLACNQIQELIEKEIGKVFLTDINFLPSEYKGWRNDEALKDITDIARAVGILPVDTSKQNTGSGSPFNQFSVQDLSFTENIKNRIDLAEWAKNKAYELIGITPQALGQQGQYETAEGVKQGASATAIQTQFYFDNFEAFKKRALDIHLAVAQQCQEEGKDITVDYVKSDLSRSFLRIGTDELTLRHLGVMAITNSKKRKELETFKGMMLQQNTTGADLLDLARIIQSDSMIELVQSAKDARKAAEERARLENERAMQQQQQQAQLDAQKAEMEHKYEIEKIVTKGEMDIRRESVLAAGRAADTNADEKSLGFVSKMTDAAIRGAKDQQDTSVKEQELALKEKEAQQRYELASEDLRLKAEQLKQRQRDNETKRYTSTINKN